jgi:hypothetical protein
MLHFHIRPHGVVLNYLRIGTALSFTFKLSNIKTGLQENTFIALIYKPLVKKYPFRAMLIHFTLVR